MAITHPKVSTKSDGADTTLVRPSDWNAAHEGGVANTLFDANTILKADTDDTPVALAVAASRVIARLAAGGIVAATAAEMATLLNWAADIAAHAALVTGIHGLALGARVYNSAAESIPNNTETLLTFDSERWDTDTIHSTSSNTSRLTCKTAGAYLISASYRWDGNATGVRYAYIRYNGATPLAVLSAQPPGTTFHAMTISTIYVLNVNDYVEVMVLQNSGDALNIAVEGANTPEFMMQRVG